jgi:hypothetical protein
LLSLYALFKDFDLKALKSNIIWFYANIYYNWITLFF